MLPHNYQNQLERVIDRELKALPEIPAPPTLIARVMQAIAENQALPWFRRAWQTWPRSLRLISFAVLAAVFGGLCYAAWALPHLGTAAATQKFGPTISLLGSLWHTVNALYASALDGLAHLNRNLLIGCIAAVALGYAMCVAFGTFCYALARNVHRFHNEN